MNLAIETLNLWAAHASRFTWPMLWQSSLLIGLLFAIDLLLRRKLRAAVRYALWLVVLLKLVLPPALAFPTGFGWWLRPSPLAPAKSSPASLLVSYGPALDAGIPVQAVPVAPALPRPRVSPAAWTLLGSGVVSLGLLAWMLVRWRQVARDIRQAAPAPELLNELLGQARHSLGLRRPVRLWLTERPISPAVCGLFRPVILLPRSLAEQLPPSQLRAVLLHELIHLRRGDVWVNCAQALLQLLYWWHPLLWLANARIRQVREEAVDDGVMLALREDAETYAPTLLEVARLALRRPLTSLGLVGILESRSSLRQRIHRLLDFHPPRKAGLTLASALIVAAFAAVAVPMGQAPAPAETSKSDAATVATNSPVANHTSAAPAEQKVQASSLVQDARLLYELGKLDEAKARLKQALALDPGNQAAWYYSDLIARPHETAAPTVRHPGDQIVRTSAGRRAILNKLNSIRLDHVFFEASTLGEALRILSKEARNRDPEKTGVNFIINSGANRSASALPAGAVAPAANSPVADLSSVRLTLKPAFTEARLVDVLDALVKSAEKPVKYTVEDYSVVFSSRLRESPLLYTRTYKLDLNSFYAAVRAATGLTDSSDLPVVKIKAARELFVSKGADLAPPKSLFYSERLGSLLVRAELKDLDIIEGAIQALNLTPAAAVGGGVQGTNGNEAASATAAPAADSGTVPLTYQWRSAETNPSPAASAPPQILIKATFLEVPEAEAAAFRSRFAVTNSPGAATWSTKLTSAQAASQLAQWEAGPGNVLSFPAMTTLSGRQSQLSVQDLATVVTLTNSMPQSYAVPVGITVDLTPTIGADGCTIQLDISASQTEFLGYEKPASGGGSPVPQFRKRELTSSASVLDHQALVLGGPVAESISKLKEKVPILGDIPYLGALFRSESTSTRKMHLLLLVTPILVDPAGNPVHSEEDLHMNAARH